MTEGATRVVAIDGPAGTGKSSVSKLLADKVGASYLDTGGDVRAVTWRFSTPVWPLMIRPVSPEWWMRSTSS